MPNTYECCALTDCPWCARDDLACHYCGGTGQWRPEKPVRDASGLIAWTRVAEDCRMCTGTGKKHLHIAAG
ncbi:hypothetical protein [Marinactinospora rubrisoli]|uniref:Uncharacterized protein n=1 Tax=Marinactinospora rubrisoli TaxID=2715399 RepID=A0ABW2KFA0_9ACTN